MSYIRTSPPSKLERRLWATVPGEMHPQKARILHHPARDDPYLWTAYREEEKTLFLHGTQKKRERKIMGRKSCCQGQDKGGGGKRIGATKAEPFISRRPTSTSQLISLLPLNLRSCCTSHPPSKERLQRKGLCQGEGSSTLLSFAFRETGSNGVCYSPQVIFPSQEV